MDAYIVKAGKMILGDGLEAKENAGLLIENGKIAKVYDNMAFNPQPKITPITYFRIVSIAPL